MIDAIFRLGETLGKGIDTFCDDPEVEHVIGIQFQRQKKSVKYLNTIISKFNKKTDYLYKRDMSGRPGLFLAGKISSYDIRNVKKVIGNKKIDLQDKTISDFVRKKITWLAVKGKLLQRDDLLDSLPKARKQELIWFKESLVKNENKIAEDIIKLLMKQDRPTTVLLTVVFNENGKEKYVGQIKDYVKFFRRGCFEKKRVAQTTPEQIVCAACNDEKIIDSFEQTPIPFYYPNKPMFSPNGVLTQSKKRFPVCDDCFPILLAGWKFIDCFLNFQVTTADEKKPIVALRFVLIPRLRDMRLMSLFQKSMSKKSLYLKQIKTLFEKLDTISTFDAGPGQVNNFLSFSTMYYNTDAHQHMRPFSIVNGVYPQRLQELLTAKSETDNNFPFKKLSAVFGINFRIGFPVLVEVYKNAGIKWQEKLAETISKIFTDKKVPIDEVIRIINLSVLNSGYKENDIKQISIISFRGLQLIEYLNRLNHEVDQPMNTTNSTPLNEQTTFYEEFVNKKSLLSDKTVRGSFAIGVSVGVLLHAQAMHHGGNTPFSSKLYREKNLEKLITFPSEVKRLLSQYDMHDWDMLVNYLAKDIADIDLDSDVSKDIIELGFSLGLSVGDLIAKGKTIELL